MYKVIRKLHTRNKKQISEVNLTKNVPLLQCKTKRQTQFLYFKHMSQLNFYFNFSHNYQLKEVLKQINKSFWLISIGSQVHIKFLGSFQENVNPDMFLRKILPTKNV